MKEAVIVSGARTPVGKAKKGSLATVRPDDLGAICVKETLKRAGGYEGNIDDLIIGCATPEAEQGLNMARNIGALAGLPYTVPAITVNRYCSSGLQSIAYAAEKIMLGAYDTAIAGGAESMSQVPMMGHVTRPNLALAEKAPEYYMSMGHTAEQVAKKYGVSREDQDAFAVRSHQNAAKALAEGKFKDEIVPVEVTVTEIGEDHKPMEKQFVFSQDEGVRPQTTADILSTLRPAFSVDGTVTAGNSSQTSDGAAAVMLMDREKADALGLAPLVKFRSFAVGGVPPEVMGIGPVEAIPRALKLACRDRSAWPQALQAALLPACRHFQPAAKPYRTCLYGSPHLFQEAWPLHALPSKMEHSSLSLLCFLFLFFLSLFFFKQKRQPFRAVFYFTGTSR